MARRLDHYVEDKSSGYYVVVYDWTDCEDDNFYNCLRIYGVDKDGTIHFTGSNEEEATKRMFNCLIGFARITGEFNSPREADKFYTKKRALETPTYPLHERNILKNKMLWFCPHCGVQTRLHRWDCKYCGQRLKWEDEE